RDQNWDLYRNSSATPESSTSRTLSGSSRPSSRLRGVSREVGNPFEPGTEPDVSDNLPSLIPHILAGQLPTGAADGTGGATRAELRSWTPDRTFTSPPGVDCWYVTARSLRRF